MGRVILQVPENVSDFLKVGSSFRVEFFKVSTFCTVGLTDDKVTVDDATGFAAGDHIYVGTSASIILTGISGSDLQFTGTTITSANNDSVVLKRDVSADASNDNYATFSDDPDFATAQSQPISVDADNQVFGFMPPGRYGRRWSTTSATVRLDHHINYDDIQWVQVTNADTPTSGIQEAINALPSGGGTAYLPPGTYTITTQINIGTANTRILGDGADLSIIKQGDGADLGGILVASGNTDDVEIAHLGIDGNVSNNTASSTVGIAFNHRMNRLHIHDCRVTQIPKDGISVGKATATSNDVRVIGNTLAQIGWEGVALRRCSGFEISGNSVTQTGNHAIGFSAGTPTSNNSTFGRVTNNFVDRQLAPATVFNANTETGFLISIGSVTADTVISNNVLIGNVDRIGAITGGDGIGLGQTASVEHERITITGNVVRKASAFGIDVPNNSIVANNFVQLSGTHGIAFTFDVTTVMSNAIVEGNIIEDCDETSTGGIAGIHIDVTASASSSANNITIRGNIVRDTRGTKRTREGLNLVCDGTRPITNLIVEGNNFKDVLTRGITWSGTNFTSIRLRNNITIADEYSGETTLVAGTKAVQNTDWPAVAGLRFNISRTDVNSSAALGILSGLFDGTDTVTITAHTQGTPATPLAADVSKVFWEFLGTAT